MSAEQFDSILRCARLRGPLAALALATAAAPALAQNSFGEATRQAPPPQQSAGPAASQGPPAGGARAAAPQAPAGGFRPSAGGGNPAPAAPGSADDPQSQIERQDLGVPPTAELHSGAMHGPTPASIPGGQVITTKGVAELLRGGQVPVLTLDVLGGAEMIQGAVYAAPASAPGSFDDATQQQFGQFLAQATGGNKQYPIVLYCLSRECWMSYNAALRAINLGYTNVLWYRGGIEAWKQAGLPVQGTGGR